MSKVFCLCNHGLPLTIHAWPAEPLKIMGLSMPDAKMFSPSGKVALEDVIGLLIES